MLFVVILFVYSRIPLLPGQDQVNFFWKSKLMWASLFTIFTCRKFPMTERTMTHYTRVLGKGLRIYREFTPTARARNHTYPRHRLNLAFWVRRSAGGTTQVGSPQVAPFFPHHSELCSFPKVSFLYNRLPPWLLHPP